MTIQGLTPDANCAPTVTPLPVAAALRAWVVRHPADRLLDPCCADGAFLAQHRYGAGVVFDPAAPPIAAAMAPQAALYDGGLTAFAATTPERFDAVAGNVAWIDDEAMSAADREQARAACRTLGVRYDVSAEPWALVLTLAASRLRPGGRMAVIVPCAIGHAGEAEPLLRFLMGRFERVQVIAVRDAFCPSRDGEAWLLYADGCGGSTRQIGITVQAAFTPTHRPLSPMIELSEGEWESWRCRLRACLLPREVRAFYRDKVQAVQPPELGQVARVRPGYGGGPLDFFHLRPSEALAARLPSHLLHPTVRHAEALADLDPPSLTQTVVGRWWRRDEPNFLLWLSPADRRDRAVAAFLDTPAGQRAKATLCPEGGDIRPDGSPWYALPKATIPAALLADLPDGRSLLVANPARCVCTASIQGVELVGGMSLASLQAAWRQPFTQLSREIAGTPTATGQLCLGPVDAAHVHLAMRPLRGRTESRLVSEGLLALRQWRLRHAA